MPERNEEMSLRDALISAMSAEDIERGAAVPEGGGQGTPEIPAEATQGENKPAEGSSAGVSATAEETAPGAAEAVAPAVAANPLANESPVPAAVPNSGMPSPTEMWHAMSQLIAENQRLNAAMQQREAQLNQQIASGNEAMQEQSRAAEGAIMQQFTPEAAIPKAQASTDAPMLNFEELSYLAPAEQQQRLAQWQQEFMNHAIRSAAAQIKDEVARDMAPVREDYEAKKRIAENEAAKATLFGMPQFADMKGKEGDLEKIIASTPILSGAAPEQRYMLAALISRGINSSRQPTTEELIEKATANPDVMKAIEARRIAEIQQNNAALPKVVPSSGMGNANAVPEQRPQTSEDIRNLMLRRLGVR